MTVIPLDTIKNAKQARVLKYISDIFDQHRGNIPDHVAFTKFNSNNHTILFNTESPELNGKTLIPFDNEGLLFAPININSIISSDVKNNNSVNVLIQKNDINWESISEDDEPRLKLFLRFDKTDIEGFSVRFVDSVRVGYKLSLQVGNDEGEALTEIPEGIMQSSYESNYHQFFQFSSPVQGATKAILTIDKAGTNSPPHEWKINNISFYSKMNGQAMKNLYENGIVSWKMIQNPTIRHGMEKEPDHSATTTTIIQREPSKLEELPAAIIGDTNSKYKDYTGTPLLYAPDLDRQFFDNISPEEIVSLSNINRLYTVTDSPSGNKIYTFQIKDDNNRQFVLKFSPTQEMNKYPDEAQTDLDKILMSGYIKQGGFKNYILTIYMKLDKINQTNQLLLWKYGGFFFSKAQPQMARAVNITIPINNKTGDTPHVYTEYTFEQFNDRSGYLIVNNDINFNGIEDGKWIGLQFIRQIDDEKKKAVQIVRINQNPMNEDGTKLINQSAFENYLVYTDEYKEGSVVDEQQSHVPAIWGGVSEILSVVGAEFVSLTGISLYEVKKE